MTRLHLAKRTQFLARFGYLGSLFHGVQEQAHLNTVLGALRKRIEKSAQQKAYALFTAARTDSGVHALENYATFYVKSPIDTMQFIKEASEHQQDGLYAMRVFHVSPHVHARGSSRGKTYRYYIIDGCDPLDIITHPFIWKVVPRLNVETMRIAAHFLIGKMDYSSLRGGGCQAHSAIKTIFYITINRCRSGIISIEVFGNAFLRKMVRNLVGLLVEIGSGLRSPSCIPDILAEKQRNAAGVTAPAHGLFLISVGFDGLPHDCGCESSENGPNLSASFSSS